MYDIIVSMIGASEGASEPIVYCCCALIIILTTVFIDLIYRLIRGICRKGDF